MILAKYFEDLNTWYLGIHTNKDWASIQIVQKIEEKLGLNFVVEPYDSLGDGSGNVCMANTPEVRDEYKDTFTPVDLLAYLYAVLHSSSYRKKFTKFSNIDFSHMPYTATPQTSQGGRENAQARFWKLVSLGGELRQLHLLQSPKMEQNITTFPVEGDNLVARKLTISSPGFEPNTSPSEVQPTNTARPRRSHTARVLDGAEKTVGKVWINDTQYFDNIPQTTWEFYFAGHRPVQKWLKDRQGLTLRMEDMLHYQKIIMAMTETHRLVNVIDAFFSDWKTSMHSQAYLNYFK